MLSFLAIASKFINNVHTRGRVTQSPAVVSLGVLVILRARAIPYTYFSYETMSNAISARYNEYAAKVYNVYKFILTKTSLL